MSSKSTSSYSTSYSTSSDSDSDTKAHTFSDYNGKNDDRPPELDVSKRVESNELDIADDASCPSDANNAKESETTLQDDKPPKLPGGVENPPKLSEKVDKPPNLSGKDDKPPKRSEKDDQPPKLSGKDDKPPKLSGKDDKPPKRSEKDDKPPKLSGKDDKPPKRSRKDDNPKKLSGKDVNPPKLSGNIEKLPKCEGRNNEKCLETPENEFMEFPSLANSRSASKSKRRSFAADLFKQATNAETETAQNQNKKTEQDSNTEFPILRSQLPPRSYESHGKNRLSSSIFASEINEKETKTENEKETEPKPKDNTLVIDDPQVFFSETLPFVSSYFAAEDRNLRGLKRGKKNTAMEDAHFAKFPFRSFDNLGLFCVFDGFSGLKVAKELTKIFPEKFEKLLKQHGISEDLSQVFRETFEKCEAELVKKEEFECIGSTCTAVAVWKIDEKVFIQSANVGDSNCVVCFDDQAMMINEEHKVSNKKEIQRLRNSGFQVQDHITRLNGISVARALGVGFLKENNVGIIPIPFISKPYAVPLIKEKAFLVIASDGLWDVIAVDYIPSSYRKSRDEPVQAAKITAQSLIAHAVKATDCVDNVTTIVVTINSKAK